MRSRSWRPAALVLLLAYVAVLMLMVLAPDSDVPDSLITASAERLEALGVPGELVTPTRVEFAWNVVVVVPVTLLASLLWSSREWTFWTAYAFVVSLSVEALQGVLLADRSATFADVVANTTGAMAGAVAAALVIRWTHSAGG